jgi:cytochrome c
MRVTASVVSIILQISHVEAQSLSVERGLKFAQSNCAHCHSIDSSGKSPLSRAPPFRDLLGRYSIEGLKELLTDAFLVDHPSMPRFELDPDQINDLIAFLATLEK